MSDFSALNNELDHWQALGHSVQVFWRDDDACTDSQALQELLAIARMNDVAMSLAVIPSLLEDSLISSLQSQPENITVLQHGFSHHNYAVKGQGQGAWELGDERPLDQVMAELKQGRGILRDAFGDRFFPVMVPPWNRISATIQKALPGAGFIALSVDDAPLPAMADLPIIKSGFDPIDWKKNAAFKGDERILSSAISGLVSQRLEEKPIGWLSINSHHLVHDMEVFGFLNRFADCIHRHQVANWCPIRSLLNGQNNQRSSCR